MKKLSTFIVSLSVTVCVWSQQVEIDFSQPIPLDPNVRIGTLSNGLTYYLRENGKPEAKIEFRLVVNVGSILEDEDQLGLAHFIEHMAFNGSKNFGLSQDVA